MRRIAIIFFIISPLFWYKLSAQEQRSYTAVRITGEVPVVDGKANEKAWEFADWSSDFIQREPYENAPPSQETVFKILYDDNHLYIAIKAYDTEPEKIEKRLSRRDHWEGDWVGVAIDSYDDNLTAFSFAVTASGVKADGLVTNDSDWDETWNPVYYTNVSSDELGWVAEMKIPYNQLRFSDTENHIWGLQVIRWLFRKQEMSLWTPVPRESARWASLFGDLKGINKIKPKKEVAITPYIMGGIETSEKEEGNPYETGQDWVYNAGVDGKVAITNDLTLNYTVNPDFGQVEADPSEVNLSAYESFFEEKRPFFVEGSNIYDYPISGPRVGSPSRRDNLFYSRRIGRAPRYDPDLDDFEYADINNFTRILGAVKLSGKTRKGWSIGIMESVTNEEKYEIDSNGDRRKGVAEPLTNYFNTRIQKDINKGNTTLGGMITATNRRINDSTIDFLPASAYTGGLDYNQFWNEKAYYLTAKMVFSYVSGSKESMLELQESPRRYYQRPDADHLSIDSNLTVLMGHGGSIEGGKQGIGNWRYGGGITWRSPGLELNDMGYLRSSDIINQGIWLNYVVFEPFSIFRTLEIGLREWAAWNFSGLLKYSGIRINANTQFKNYFRANLGFVRRSYEIEQAELRGGPSFRYPGSWGGWMFVGTDERKKLFGHIKGSFGVGDNQYKKRWEVGAGLSYRPIGALQLSIEPEFETDFIDARYVETSELDHDNRYIIARLDKKLAVLNLRINLSITPDLSIQFWGQPFFFSGDYSKFKVVTDSPNTEFSSQFHVFNDNEIRYNEPDNNYSICDPYINENNCDLETNPDYTFDNPDFSVYDFRSNFVIRWEYIPGSTAYFVWSQGRVGDNSYGAFDFNRHIQDLLDTKSSNVFLLKFSYRFSF